MIYKQYGKTGKNVSAIGFGGMRFNKKGSNYDIDECAMMVRKANELGINYFDTAPYYCDMQSEVIFGEAFKNMPGQFYISTKSSANNGSELRKDLERSLLKLGVPKINFFHIWCILTLDDYKSRIVKGGAYDEALKAKEEGLIEHIVFSSHCNGDEIDMIIKDNLFEGMTAGYNIVNFPYRQKGLKSAYEHNLGVATMNPLGGGLIPQNEEYFNFIKEDDNDSVVSSAIRFNASHDEISTVLIGMSSMEDVIQCAGIGNNLSKYSKEKLSEIENNLSTSMNELCTGCRYCEKCPNNIQISKFMVAYNQKILDDAKHAKSYLGYHFGLNPIVIKNCVECGMCEKSCTQHLPIIKRLKEIAEDWK